MINNVNAVIFPYVVKQRSNYLVMQHMKRVQ